jgi:hypothetical protein
LDLLWTEVPYIRNPLNILRQACIDETFSEISWIIRGLRLEAPSRAYTCLELGRVTQIMNAKYSPNEQVQEFVNHAEQLVFIMEIL